MNKRKKKIATDVIPDSDQPRPSCFSPPAAFGTSTCGPVVNIPVVTGLVDQAVVEVQLLLCHVVQVFFSKEAKNERQGESG